MSEHTDDNTTSTSKGHSITLKNPSEEKLRADESRKLPKQHKPDMPLGHMSAIQVSAMHLGAMQFSSLRDTSIARLRADVSKINYMPSRLLDLNQTITGQSLIQQPEPPQELVPTEVHQHVESVLKEQFPVIVTSLLNEDQLWGCFYNFPELYTDVYSPVVKIRNIEDVPELVGGELTRDMVTACLRYLKRSPIMGDFVYIKLDLSSKHLINISVLQHYKYLVYLDLSTNLLTELSVLSYLLYLQYLSVAFNRLSTVLEYETPQWFLTEVHYKFNSVKRIRDLRAFWSITILDLSHNNIKTISGLENLKYLRRLDLSFNHIQRLENLNHLRLLWLDVSYNNISSFEFGCQTGLWTLLHLEYLNLNENNLISMKMFSGCTRLRELHARNNRLSMLLELAVYMRQIRRLIILDLRANPICSVLGYKDIVINTFPLLLSLDAVDLDPVDQYSLEQHLQCCQRTAKMEMTPPVNICSGRRLLRMLYIEQLSRAQVSPFTPPANTTEVSIIVLVGYEGVGKGKLSRRLATECSEHIMLATQHTTAPYHSPGHYEHVTREKFDDMLLAGMFLTYTEMDGESYGLSRKECFVQDGKVRLACMDLETALMLKHRGRRPIMILCSLQDKLKLLQKQQVRKTMRNSANEQRHSLVTPIERSTLQVMLSGRIIITGILNEIFMCLPEDKEKSEFVIESECSLMMDSEARQAVQEYARGVNLLTLLAASSSSLEVACKRANERPSSQLEPSLYSLYKESQGTGEYSYANNSYQDRKKKYSDTANVKRPSKEKPSSIYQPKSVDFSRYASSTWKGSRGLSAVAPDSSKSSKSVTFTATEAENPEIDPTGMMIEPPDSTDKDPDDTTQDGIRSISTRVPWPNRGQARAGGQPPPPDDLDLWLAFLTETGIMQASDLNYEPPDSYRPTVADSRVDDQNSMIREMNFHNKTPCETISTTVRDDYEGIHLLNPGLFWDTVTMDNRDVAFIKTKKIIQDIVNSQKYIKPMFDIDFTDLADYPTVKKRVNEIREQIAPHTLFH